ncbi:MAG: phage holin family protein [Candidatus Moranbacteria bacterium]|nr:phage holin family protein [Candidatus Moranbacteria bacterium]
MLLFKWLVSALAFLALPYIVAGISVQGFGTALILALLWGLLNITIRPVLLLLALPFNLLTFGIFTFIINGFLLWLLGGLIKGFEVQGFLAAILGALVLSAVSSLTHWVLHKSEM